MSRRNKRKQLSVSPIILSGNIRYALCLAEVMTRTESGQPSTIRLIEKFEVVDMRKVGDVMTLYIPERPLYVSVDSKPFNADGLTNCNDEPDTDLDFPVN